MGNSPGHQEQQVQVYFFQKLIYERQEGASQNVVSRVRLLYTGCPTILFPLCFWLFLGFLIRYTNGFIVLSTALSMLVMKHTLTLFLDEIFKMIFVKQCRGDKFKTNILLQIYSFTICETLRGNSPKVKKIILSVFFWF